MSWTQESWCPIDNRIDQSNQSTIGDPAYLSQKLSFLNKAWPQSARNYLLPQQNSPERKLSRKLFSGKQFPLGVLRDSDQPRLLAHVIEELLSFRTHYHDLAYNVRTLRYPAWKWVVNADISLISDFSYIHNFVANLSLSLWLKSSSSKKKRKVTQRIFEEVIRTSSFGSEVVFEFSCTVDGHWL